MVDKATIAQLKDLHEPQAIASWPWGWGWYGLGVAILILLLLGSYWGYRWYQRTAFKRQALKQLKLYKTQYQQQQDLHLLPALLNELLKKVAIHYFPRQQVASLTAEAWLDFLNRTVRKIDFYQVKPQLIMLPYQKMPVETDLARLFEYVRIWINQRGGICLN